MTTHRQAGQQQAKGSRSESGGIRLYLSPRAEQGHRMGGQEERRSGVMEAKRDSGKQIDCKSLTSGRGVQVAGRAHTEQGRGSPTIGRGRKLPERDIPDVEQHSPNTGKDTAVWGQGSLRPEEGVPNMGRMENDQEGGGNKDRDVQKADPLILEHSPPRTRK